MKFDPLENSSSNFEPSAVSAQWLSMTEAATHTPYSAEYLSLLARKNRLPSKKIGNVWYTNKAALDAYMQKQMLRAQISNSQFPISKPVLSTNFQENLRIDPIRSYQGDINKYFPKHADPAKTKEVVHGENVAHIAHMEKALERVLEKKNFQFSISKQTEPNENSKLKIVRTPRSHFKTVASSKILVAAALVSVVLLSTLPVPFVFSFFDKSVDYVMDALKDANTVMGFRPGTHANEILLLNNDGSISIMGHIETEGQLRAYSAQGIAPILVTSTTTVENLSADTLDSVSSEEFTLAFITKNGNVTTENVVLDGEVSIGQTLQVKGATKLLNELEVEGELKAFGRAEFMQAIDVLGPAYFEALVTMADDLDIKGNLDVGKNISVRGSIEAGSAILGKSGSFGSLGVSGSFSAGGKITLGSADKTITITAENLTLDKDGNIVFGGGVTANGFSGTTLSVTNSTSTNATSTNFFSNTASTTNLHFIFATGTSATTTNFFTDIFRSTLATITSLIADDITVGALTATNSTTTNSTTTNAFVSSLTASNATSTNFFTATASSTNLFSTTGNIGVLTIGSGTLSNLLVTGSTTLQNFTFVNATGTSATTTNFFSTKGTFDELYVNDYQQNDGTFLINSSVATGDIFAVQDSSITSGTLIHQTLTANAGNGQVSRGQIIDLVDSTTAGGGYDALSINVTGSGVGSGTKTLLSLNPGGNNTVVFDNTGALRPTTDVSTNTNTVGSASYYWKNGYFDTLTANNLSGTVVTGATSNDTWTIGSTEASDDLKSVIFQRNSGSGNATFSWNSGANDLRYLSVNYPFNSTYTVSDASIGTAVDLYSGALTNNTTSGTQTLLSLSNTGTGTTESGIYLTNTGTGTTALEIAGTWTNGILTNNNSLNTGSGNISSTGLGTFGTILATGSTTLQNFTFTNATGTSATTTNFFSTTASSTNFYTTNLFANTANLTESGNLFYTDDRVNSYIHASTTIPKLYTANTFSGLQTFSQTVQGSISGNAETVTNGVYTTTFGGLFDTRLSATTTLPNLTTLLGLTDIITTRSTTTNATSTNFFATTASSTNLFSSVASIGGSAFNVIASGNVGIGTTNPGYRFHVEGASSLGNQAIAGYFTATTTTDSVFPRFTFTNATGTSATTTNLYASNITSGNIMPAADDTYDLGTSTARWRDFYVGPSSLHLVSTVGETATARDWKIGIDETDGTSEGNFRIMEGSSNFFNISAAGNVGIGTTTPTELLTVYGDSKRILLDTATAGGQTGILMQGGGGTSYKTEILHDTGNLSFLTTQDGTLVPRLYISGAASGNVGIGTTGPTNKLEVDGGAAETRLRISTTGIDAREAGIILSNSSKTAFNDGIVISHGAGYTVIDDLVGSEIARFMPQSGTVGNTYFAGKVGIGTTDLSSNAKLRVEGSGIYIGSARSDTVFTGGPSTQTAITGPSGYWAIRSGANESFNLDVYNSNAEVAAFTVLQNGNVGIGTTGPATTLDVRRATSAQTDIISARDSTWVLSKAVLGSYSGEGEIYAFGSDGVEKVRFTTQAGRHSFINSGNVGIGTTVPGYKLAISALTAANYKGLYVQAGGDSAGSYNSYFTDHYGNPIMYLRGDDYPWVNQAWGVGSDRRLKENIVYIEADGLNKILALKPVSFDYLNGAQDNLGFIAQDVQEVIPEAVTVGDQKTGMLSLKSDFIVPYLVSAIKELNSRTITFERDASDTQAQKQDVSEFEGGLALINSLKTKAYNLTGSTVEYHGFVVEDVASATPSAIVEREDGTKVVDYLAFIPALVQSVQDLYAQMVEVKDTMLAWADKFTSREIVATEKICIGGTCINESQLIQLLQNSGMTASAMTSEPTTDDPQPTATSTPSESPTATTTDTTATTTEEIIVEEEQTATTTEETTITEEETTPPAEEAASAEGSDVPTEEAAVEETAPEPEPESPPAEATTTDTEPGV
ncbi:MAG: tail fiber domain-containing protein [Candidatus Zambryskibacteria bacterium]|nr:tail fiber domain-containing protein [Candidatus Zambryskibacteria bacterium]